MYKTDDRTVGLAKSAIDRRDDSYFASHGLADLLGEEGIENGRDAVLALVQRLTADDAYAYLAAISAGLRDSASDCDEFARAAGGAAEKVRRDALQGPLVDVLVDIGRSRPGAAAGAASRMIGLGDADFGAYLIGGAYGGAAAECDGAIERLLSSGSEGDAAAAVRALRVAAAEHGSPGAGRVRSEIGRALQRGGAEVERECMEALLDMCGRGDAEAEAMVESMAAGRRACLPVLAARIRRGSPFGDERSLRHLRACVACNPGQGTVHSAYFALAEMAGRMPQEVAAVLLHMFDTGRYHGALAGMAMEELGRRHARVAIAAVLDALENPRYTALGDGRLDEVVGGAVRYADREDAAAMVIRAMDERPAAAHGACLAVLSAIAAEDGRAGGGPGLTSGILSRISGHPACEGKDGGAGPERAAAIGRMREIAAAAAAAQPAA